jgi:hypothetical protein
LIYINRVVDSEIDPSRANVVARKELEAADDLTLVPQLGRSKRDAMEKQIATVAALAEINPDTFINGHKTPFSR